jgi:hypothetical protein
MKYPLLIAVLLVVALLCFPTTCSAQCDCGCDLPDCNCQLDQGYMPMSSPGVAAVNFARIKLPGRPVDRAVNVFRSVAPVRRVAGIVQKVALVRRIASFVR